MMSNRNDNNLQFLRLFLFAIPIMCSANIPVVAQIGTTIKQTSKDSNSINKRMFDAVVLGRSKTLNKLLNQGADPNSIDPENRFAPLHYAAISGDVACAKILLAKGAKVDMQEFSTGNTPLIMACGHSAKDPVTRNRYVYLVRLLIRYRAKINLQNKEGNTPLMNSVGRGNLPLVRILLRHGANLNIQNKKGRTAIMIARRPTKDLWLKKKRADIEKMLTQSGLPSK